MNLSQCQLRLRQLNNEMAGLMAIFMERKPLLKGTVYLMKTKCGKKGCKCEREGKLHTVWRWTRSQEGKPVAKYLTKEEVVRYKKLTQNYQRFRQARARLVKIHREQIKLINFLEDGLREEERSKGR